MSERGRKKAGRPITSAFGLNEVLFRLQKDDQIVSERVNETVSE